MRGEGRLFAVVAAFLVGVGAVYALWTWLDSGRVELAGTIAILGSAILCGMCWGYMALVSRRIAPRPEDRHDAEIDEGAGVVGFFSPGSYWPVAIGAAAFFAGSGLIYTQWWLVGVGAVAMVAAVAGLLFEYYTGSRRTSE